MSSLAALRDRIAAVTPPPPLVQETVATGIAALDALLPGHGVPCGRLTEITGRAGSGVTTLVRQLVARALADKRWVAYVDATRTLAPGDWAPLANTGRLWIVRPPIADHGPWCADLLLRSQAFGLVVLDDPAPIARSVAVRLTRLAQEHQAAFVVVRHQDNGPHTLGSALRLVVHRTLPTADRPATPTWRQRLVRAAQGQPTARERAATDHRPRRVFHCTVVKGGKHGPQTLEVTCVLNAAYRLRPDPPVPDRRGVATRNRLGQRTAPDAIGVRRTTTPVTDSGGTALARKRRCAEPAVTRDAFLFADSTRPKHNKRPKPTPKVRRLGSRAERAAARGKKRKSASPLG